MEDKSEWYDNREEKYTRIVHGEINALIFAGRPVDGCILYTYPFMPCAHCATIMIQAGITRFVAPIPTDDQLDRWADHFARTKKYATECGIEVVEYEWKR